VLQIFDAGNLVWGAKRGGDREALGIIAIDVLPVPTFGSAPAAMVYERQ
jgi:hypothetical protein